MRIRLVIVLVALAALATPQVAAADVATDWNRAMVDALLVSHTAPQPGTRIAAIVQSSAFDAVNGVTQRYAQFHPDVLGGATAPRGASKAAAVAGAAYTALVALFPAQKATFDAQLATTLSQLSDDSAEESGTGRAVTRGLAWGQTVANAFLAWRSTDGLTAVLPPYVVGLPPFWQPTLPAFAGPTLRQFAAMTPWAMTSPSQFLPPPAPALTSAQYATDLNEVETIGNASTATPENVATAQFWNGKAGGGGDTVATIWNRAADGLADAHPVPLVDNARRFALLDVSMADAVIAIWNAKNVYNTWRPITAIRNANIDGNDATLANATWTPVLPTPPFQEYPSGHSGVSAAAAAQLSSFYGNDTPFSVTSDGLPGVTRIYASFSDAIADVALARVAGGIHFRFACDVAAQMGAAIAAQATAKQMTRLHGQDN